MSTSFSEFNRALMADLRANGGRATSGPFKGHDVLIVRTTGAKSGEARETPLAYFPEDRHYLVIASKGGAPTNPSWYNNLVSNPMVTVEVLGQIVSVRARVPAADERDRLFAKIGAKHPAYLQYQQKTSRKIPVVLLEPIA